MVDKLKPSLQRIWPQILAVDTMEGGLFNDVYRIRTSDGVSYLKQLMPLAKSKDFPPLPTTPEQRCLVATSWHGLALRTSHLQPQVGVPKIEAVDTRHNFVAMSEVPGVALQSALLAGNGEADDVLPTLLTWMGQFHQLRLEPKNLLLSASEAFKVFKIDLQYSKLLEHLPSDKHFATKRFISSYLADHSEAVHGDLNSRNILVTASKGVAIIDFEQGHFGHGIYDLAYLLSEYVLRDLNANQDPEVLLRNSWSKYLEIRKWTADDLETEKKFSQWRVHLAFQVFYRLVGPSRKTWTGHFSESTSQMVRSWFLNEIHRWLN